MLAQTLKALERDGLVSRQVAPTVPITVEYAMTPLGETLALSIRVLWDWSDRHIGEVMESRRWWTTESEPSSP